MPLPLRAAGVLLVIGSLAACGASPAPRPDTPSGPVVTATPATIPADGVSLATLGFRTGPIQQLSLPRSTLLRARTDQPNAVTAVIADPPPAEVAAYLRRTLPAAGFTVVEDDLAAMTLRFRGYGWSGWFTGAEQTSALLLRPG